MLSFVFFRIFYKAYNCHLTRTRSYVILRFGTWAQFHQHYTYSFCTPRPRKRKKIQLSHQCLFMLLGSTNEKTVRRTLMKLIPVHEYRCQFQLRFTCSFYAHSSQKCKIIQLSHLVSFYTLGSLGTKAVHRTLMK